jgi:two-component system LytT family response regulator
MISTVIIDDEEDARVALKLMIEKYCPEVFLKGVYETPEQGLQAIRDINPDLVFLDIQMPYMSGFDLLQQLAPIAFEVIFISAYDQYAIKAIKFSALDYLLKPIDLDELNHALRKVKDRLKLKSSTYQYQSVIHNMKHRSGMTTKLAVPTQAGIELIEADDIICCKADGSYTTLFLKNKQSMIVSRNLKDFENFLEGVGFCRVHHSSLINLKHVKRYVKGEGGYVVLSEDHEVEISRRKKEEFLGLLHKV